MAITMPTFLEHLFIIAHLNYFPSKGKYDLVIILESSALRFIILCEGDTFEISFFFSANAACAFALSYRGEMAIFFF